MKKYFLSVLALILLVPISSFSQVLKPVKWQFSTEKINENEAYLVFKAVIENNWHMYGMNIPEGGPVATSFTFDSSKTYKLIGGYSIGSQAYS